MRKTAFKAGLSSLLVIAMLIGLLSGCSQPIQQTVQPVVTATEVPVSTPAPEPAQVDASASTRADGYENNLSYLKTYFNITDTNWTAETFSAALAAVAGDESVAVEGDFNGISAMKAAVISAGYDELAKSYPQEKIKSRLAVYGLENASGDASAAYLACGMDAKLLRPEEVKNAVEGKELSKEYAAELLMAVADANGNARNFMGYSDDPKISAELDNMWNSFVLFDQPDLTAIGKKAVEEGITTGYNLKNDVFNARFLPELTLQYGHSDIKHAHQLLGLLSSENIVAKVQLEPKISIYRYMLEWGAPPTEATPTYEVRKYTDDLYLVFAVEYDLQLEFANADDMLRFDDVIKTFAKKSGDNKDAVGLIYGSWWQPLYSTTKEGMPADNYFKIHDCVIRDGVYSIHPFCLDEVLTDTVEKLNAINPAFQVEPVTRYCNKAFHNYMTGEDSQ